MSGVELLAVLGVAASAAQLIDYSLKVVEKMSEIYIRVKEAPRRVIRYTTQINQIVAVGRAIKESQDLQTSLINSQLQNTLTEVQHLLRILGVIQKDYTTGSSSKRVWKAIVGSEEKRMLMCFERLEKEKTALILCISVVHTQALQTIGIGFGILVNKDMKTTKDKKKESSIASKLKKKEKSKAKDPVVGPSSSGTAVAVMPSNKPLVLRDPARPDSGYAQSSPSASTDYSPQEKNAAKEPGMFEFITASKKATQYNGNINELKKSSHIYSDIAASTGCFQQNGNRGGTGPHKHKRIHATRKAVQINGNIVNIMTDKELKKLTESQYVVGENSDAETSEEQETEEEYSDED